MRPKPDLEIRPPDWRDPFGNFTPALLAADWYDRQSGQLARKAARWGYLKPPPGTGKVVWVICGNSADSVTLGVELTRAIREKRLDIRLVLTFEREFPAQLDFLQGLPETGYGYAPADHRCAIQQAFKRFDPFAVIFCGTHPRQNLSSALGRVAHCVAVATAAAAQPAVVEYVYPASEQQARSWQSQASAPIADFTSLLVEAQIDPNFRTLINGSKQRHLWWLHSDDVAAAGDLAARFRTVFRDDVLFISGIDQPQTFDSGDNTLTISTWNRGVLAAGTIMLVNDNKWLPAIAAAVTATHLETLSPRVLWQAMAGGAAVSCADHTALPKKNLREALAEFKSHEVLLYQWRAYRDNPILARGHADGARRKFWQERRLAAHVNAELLERVFAW